MRSDRPPPPDPAGRLAAPVAATRRAVRAALADLPAGALVLAATSGGPDSMALAAALAFVAPRRGLRGGLVTVDHGLQEGSDRRAATLVGWAEAVRLDPREAVAARVRPDHTGPENAARTARYAALDEAAGRLGADAVLLGHTADDQAETVLLRLARGSGARSLAGMPALRGRYRRPFLGLPRATTVAACRAQHLPVWEDPTNADPAFRRSRVRHGVMRALTADLGPGAAAALARTARLLRDDADALDAWAQRAVPPGAPLDAATLAGLPRAVRTRVLRRAALAAGCPAGSLTAVHVDALDRLITDWHGQGPVALPGGLVGQRAYGRLRVDARHGDHPSGYRAGPRHRGPDPQPDH